METPPISVSEFKAYFTREFIYGTDPDKVKDNDISRAINEAALVFNSSLWEIPNEQVIAYYYVTAHFLALNIRSGSGASSSGSGSIASKSVGSVSVGYSLPQSIANDKILSGFLKTEFGIRYLQLLAARLVGNVMVLESGSNFDYLGI